MLGRVRSSTVGSLELLEMERKPSKINKHDPLSIYESTLLKLKEGSRCSGNDSSKIDSSDVEATDEAIYTNSSCRFEPPSKGLQRTSILDMFAKYNKSSQNLERADDQKVFMDVEAGASSS